jgi:hypothetical protein
MTTTQTAQTYDQHGNEVAVSFEPTSGWMYLRVAGVELWVSQSEWRDIRRAGDHAMESVLIDF